MGDVLDLMGPGGSEVAAELAASWCKRSGTVKGDYLEFGTFRGRSFLAFYRAAEKHGLGDMRFLGFDSFEGLPETPTCRAAKDGDSPSSFVAGNYSCSQDEFTQILTDAGVDMDRVILTPGFFDQSLTPELARELPTESAAIVNIDCDLYESTVDVLSFVTPYLRNGTLLLFDDWLAYGAHPYRGEQRACHEWLQANPHLHLTEYFKYTHSGVAFIVSMVNSGERRAMRLDARGLEIRVRSKVRRVVRSITNRAR